MFVAVLDTEYCFAWESVASMEAYGNSSSSLSRRRSRIGFISCRYLLAFTFIFFVSFLIFKGLAKTLYHSAGENERGL